MHRLHALLCTLLLCAATGPALADDERDVRAADARYWQAFNQCDLDAMQGLFTDDVEFYHDKTGLTASKAAVIDSFRKGPCNSPALHLRREAVAGSERFHPLAGGFALLSGTHRFHVRTDGQPERLDGQAEYTNLWQSVDGQWRMRRVFSYAHEPAPYVPPTTRVTLPAAALAAFAGTYRGKTVGDIRVDAVEGGLRLASGEMRLELRAESPRRFFALERDLRFEFAPATGGDLRAPALTVSEGGKVVATAARVD